MSDVAARFRTFLADAPHWADLLAAVPAQHVLKHDTIHPVFHGCIDWHSACHGVWALIAHRGLTGSNQHTALVDSLLMPVLLAQEAEDLATHPDFEMPYGRAWLLRLVLEDRLVTGSTRLGSFGREVAKSLVERYRQQPPDPFAREYANPCWALINLFDYARVEGQRDIESFAREAASVLSPSLDRLPASADEESWPDFMAVVPNLCDLLIRTGAASADQMMQKVGARLLALRPVTRPTRPHHYALNFSRAWALFALHEATRDEILLAIALDHLETGLARPSWWRGDYRAVAHWVPQFALFALQRAMKLGREPGTS
jgi:hypothetical protein